MRARRRAFARLALRQSERPGRRDAAFPPDPRLPAKRLEAKADQIEQKADGTFERHLIMGAKPDQNAQGVAFSQLHAVDLVDVNGDGLMDIVTGKRYFAHGSHGDIGQLDPAVLYWFELKRGPSPLLAPSVMTASVDVSKFSRPRRSLSPRAG